MTAWLVVVLPLRGDILNNDLTLIYIGARIGLEHGWTHIYSLPLQHELFMQMRPHAPFNDGERFLSPPPFAWLVLPLTLVGPAGAVYVWIIGSVLALVAAWWIAAPGQGPARILWLLAALAWYPVLYSLSLAQPDLLLVLLMAAGWRLAEAKRPYLAGIVLGVSVIKPQLTIVLPLLLLVSGRWRIAAAWVVTAAVLAAISLAVIGGQGLSDYRSPQGVVIAIAVAGAYLNRRSTHARVFALGILATTIGATYWHLQDFTILVLAAWLFWREHPPAWQRWWLLVVVLGGELAWPLTPLPVLVGVAVWFAFMVAPPRLISSKPAMATT
ncbi:MAG: DUF2029 domain-containing protein [Chloroflexi bacterium]|nr:MAG: DUF2029 domain-containing protein [Chloroflexota bacterium]